MIETIVLWLIAKGIPAKYARWALIAAAATVAFAGCVALKTCYEHRIISRHDQVVAGKALEGKIVADEKSTVQREKDKEAEAVKTLERKDAIANEKDTTPSDSSLALGCTRLRQQGYKTDQFPECSGR